ncbi:hypothetical protein [Streptomyces shenzhenensis]|uniref:hypothetical protein n=1 Tax=Streptomyces shenzhenensis TaxID=943815 RepID=UPI001F40A07C|nr:hypothetical protein [Streptomyces shenzhenensis]
MKPNIVVIAIAAATLVGGSTATAIALSGGGDKAPLKQSSVHVSATDSGGRDDSRAPGAGRDDSDDRSNGSDGRDDSRAPGAGRDDSDDRSNGSDGRDDSRAPGADRHDSDDRHHHADDDAGRDD